MTKVTHFNQFGTQTNRVVATYATELEGHAALNEARRTALAWNKAEKRENMKVNFILIGTGLSVM